ncbi:MAG: primosomal protein N' [Clostridiales bacterium]|nr:primosomal protein N' [Clostridiales bacterium]
MKYVDVIIDNKTKHTDNLYTYACPFDEVKEGQKVYVTFGKGDRPKEAYVFNVKDSLEKELKNIKEVKALDKDIVLTHEMLETALFMKRRYLCNTIDALKCFTPAGSPLKSGKKRKPPFEGREGEDNFVSELTQEQKNAMNEIIPCITDERHELFLIHGVTGSGKTEVYMRTVDEVLKKGKTAIMLVPEISLTKQIIDRFFGRFGHENIAVLHSKLGPGERYDEWMRIRRGEARIVIGARSAVFAPLENIGAIIIDEEHESSYKSDTTPKYETIEIAIKRAKQHNAVVIAGSATPSVITSVRADAGIYKRITMKERYNSVLLPEVETVDMRDELMKGNRSVLSESLYEEMSRCLEEKKQVILFLNRRGYAPFVSCRECGYVVKCEDCGISMVYHRDENALVCHYCGRKVKLPEKCPECGSKYIRYFGAGTEKLEEEVERLFPDAGIARLDLDTIKTKGSIDRILNDFKKRKTDILIGTQLVAKGLDFENVGLVGIIAADITLNIPDFRASERTFQLITQAAGRAGRGDERGRVIIQTYSPEHYAIQAAAAQDYDEFFEKEKTLRHALGYPPYCDMIQVVVSADDETTVEEGAGKVEELIREKLGREAEDNLIGKRPAPIGKLSGKYRYHLILKSPLGRRKAYGEILTIIRDSLAEDKNNKFNVAMDINPFSFM